MKKYSLIIVFVLLFCFTPFKPLMANSSDVVINEIAWMGTDVSANDEWIELYNNTDNDINIDGWILKADDGTPEINLSGIIPEKGFYLLERTDDETVAGITADLIYTGALENSGENLKLYDNLNNLIDEVNCSEKWLAGDNITKQTMEKTSAGWQTSKEPGGTPKTENSKLPEDGPRATEPPQAEPVSYPTGIVFNEIMPSPEGPDETEEWIEIFNQNNFEVGLASWQIKDKEGKTTTYTFSEGIKITALGYLVLKRPETKITLNNEGDGLELLNPKGGLVDSTIFGKAPQNQSYDKTPSSWTWSTNLTPNSQNIISTPQPANEKTNEKKSEPAVDDSRQQPQKKELAAVGRQVPKSSGFLYTFLIAFGIALFSGIIILALKKKLTKNSRGIDKS